MSYRVYAVQSDNVIPRHEVIRRISDAKGDFAAWIGAGLSFEAGIKAGVDICHDIRDRLAGAEKPADLVAWAREHLDWDDLDRRYSRCLSKLGPAASRIKYFRGIIRGIQPSFSHHAIVLLMRYGCLRRSCLTTNFDKLLEMAFAQQAVSEFQAIRSEEERQYWGDEDKQYVIKLHGDYDTANILNTHDEAIRIPPLLQQISTTLLQRSGLLVLGSSGYEQSVIRFFDDLWGNSDETILELGVFWGVYMGDYTHMDPADEIKELRTRIAKGAVSKNIVDSAARAAKAGREFHFFPVWGAGRFLFDLVEGMGNADLAAEARRYLDHRMRLQDLFKKGGLQDDAIDTRLRRLDERAQRLRTAGTPVAMQPIHVLQAAPGHAQEGAVGEIQVHVVYGDLANRGLLGLPLGDGRRAVVSPDDTFLSASGGAALALLEAAGKAPLLSEMSKFASVAQHDVVVTSAFNLPVNYIFHAATAALSLDGSSNTTDADVYATMLAAFRAAQALLVRFVFTPLIGAGTEAVETDRSLTAILNAFAEVMRENPDVQLGLVIVIRDEADLSRREAANILQSKLPEFRLTQVASNPG